nr:hypothetical protein [Tanacetum cinerariifolium]
MSATMQGMNSAEINQIVIRQETTIEKNANSKMKFENKPKDNCVPQQPHFKKPDVARDCNAFIGAMNQRAPLANPKATITCYECGRLRHFRNECQKFRSQNQVNQIWKEKDCGNSSVVKDKTNA